MSSGAESFIKKRESDAEFKSGTDVDKGMSSGAESHFRSRSSDP